MIHQKCVYHYKCLQLLHISTDCRQTYSHDDGGQFVYQSGTLTENKTYLCNILIAQIN